MWPRLCMLGMSLLVADACRETVQQPLSPAAVVGCYEFADSIGHPLGAAADFWAAPIRLDTVLAPVEGDSGYSAEPGYYVAVTTAPVNAMDTAFFRATWQVLPPDTLLITRSNGFTGQSVSLVGTGPTFTGREVWFGDVIDTTRRPAEHAVRARRVACPVAGGAASRPAA
jgi:hypothetical protein